MLFINKSLIKQEQQEIITDIQLLTEMQKTSIEKHIINYIIYHINILENYDISYYLNNNELEIVNSYITSKMSINELPKDLLIRYFTALRQHHNEYLSYIFFTYNYLPQLFGDVYFSLKKLNIRSDMFIRKAIFYIIMVRLRMYLDKKEEKVPGTNVNVKNKYSLGFKYCNVCYALPKEEFECKKCTCNYCSQSCKDFDKEILNHETFCYYERPLEFYFEDSTKPNKLFVTKIFDWKYYIDSGTLRDVLVSNYVKICKKPLIRKRINLNS